MRTMKSYSVSRRSVFSGTAAVVLAASFFGYAGSKAFADGVSMAPPFDYTSQQPIVDATNVFRWSEIPVDQRVPLSRVIFDKSGYQLFDQVGETIVVPFTNNNLYVMKFAVSPDGSTFFENTGGAPILYLPRDGYLVNESAGGSRWYPFTDGFAPETPVFLGCAPSWDAFCNMGWYPEMAFYGGYWCGGPRFSFGALIPCDGFVISIGFNDFHGWNGYRDYYRGHPGFYNTGFVGRDWRTWDGHRDGGEGFRGGDGGHSFGDNHGDAGNGFGNHVLRGYDGYRGGSQGNRDDQNRGFDNQRSNQTFDNHSSDNGHTFRGVNGGNWTHSSNDGNSGTVNNNNHNWNNGGGNSNTVNNNGQNHTWNSGGGNSGNVNNNGQNHNWNNGGDSSSVNNNGQNHTWNNGGSNSGTVDNGGQNHSSNNGQSQNSSNGGSHGSNGNGSNNQTHIFAGSNSVGGKTQSWNNVGSHSSGGPFGGGDWGGRH